MVQGVNQAPGWARWVDPRNVETTGRQLADGMHWTEQVEFSINIHEDIQPSSDVMENYKHRN